MKTFPFSYEIIYSNRKSLAIQVTADGQVKVRAPKGMSSGTIRQFITQKEDWILKHIAEAKSTAPASPAIPLSDAEEKRYREIARSVFTQKVAYYASIMNVTYGRISIRDQKTRWGSCSSVGNLNFNWRLIFAPEEVVDYVVVHELAHRREMNHSAAFYAIVESVLPDYKERQLWLRHNGRSLSNFVERSSFTDHSR
jgi:hypothetical protein